MDDPRQQVLGLFDRTAWIITASADGETSGLANAEQQTQMDADLRRDEALDAAAILAWQAARRS